MNKGAEVSAKNAREKALKGYYENPNVCQFCGKIIEVPEGAKVSEVRRKKYCDRSCAAKGNNAKRKSKATADTVSDEIFIKAVNESSSITQVGKAIGYKSVGSSVTEKIRERMKTLEIELGVSSSKLEIDKVSKGELFSKRANWQSARSSVARYARKVFNESDKPKCCAICGYDNHYEVAHIKAVSNFSDDTLVKEINHIDNLIALCPNHHWEYDNGILKI